MVGFGVCGGVVWKKEFQVGNDYKFSH